MNEYLKEVEELFKKHYAIVENMSLSTNQKQQIAIKNLILNVENQYMMICESDLKDKHELKEDLRILVLETHKFCINYLFYN